MYRQSDGVAMGSPLGSTLANIFMGYLEENYFSTNVKPLMYVRYVDDCFILFKNENDCKVMFEAFNRLHQSISFTMESQQDGCLPFLNVSVQREETNFVTSL